MDYNSFEYQHATFPSKIYNEPSLAEDDFKILPQENAPTQFFFPGEINIFTTAVKEYNNSICLLTSVTIFTDFNWNNSMSNLKTMFIENGTINHAEIYAVRLGIHSVESMFPSINHVNIFTDSQKAFGLIRKELKVSHDFKSLASLTMNYPALGETISSILSTPIAVSLYFFKSSNNNTSYLHGNFKSKNERFINMYDTILCASYTNYIANLAKMCLLNMYTHF